MNEWIGKKVIVVSGLNERHIYYGTLTEISGHKTKLSNARIVNYWTKSDKKIARFATIGPQKKNRITSIFISDIIPNITVEWTEKILECTKQAIDNWEKMEA